MDERKEATFSRERFQLLVNKILGVVNDEHLYLLSLNIDFAGLKSLLGQLVDDDVLVLVDEFCRAPSVVEDAGTVYLLALELFRRYQGASGYRAGEAPLQEVGHLIRAKRHYEAADYVIRAVRDVRDGSVLGLEPTGVGFDYCVTVYPHRKAEIRELFLGGARKGIWQSDEQHEPAA
jgi:hypothetical protein